MGLETPQKNSDKDINSAEIDNAKFDNVEIDNAQNAEASLKPNIWRRTAIGKYLRIIPRKKQMKGSWLHKKFGERFLSSDYWELSRSGVAKGFAIGCFWAMIPMPFQMVPSGIFAMVFRANIPLALLAVWITNPITHPFVIAFQLWLGEKLLNEPSSFYILQNEGIWELIKHAPMPIITAALLCAVILSAFGFFLARFSYDLAIRKIIESYKRKHKV